VTITRSRDMGFGSPDLYVPPGSVNEGSSTNCTFSTLTNPDGDGKNYRMAVFNATGTLVVSSAGRFQALIVDGGYSGVGVTNNSGYGGQGGKCKFFPSLELTVATHTITIGAGGAGIVGGSVAGGASSIGSNTTSVGVLLNFPGGVAGSVYTPGYGGPGLSNGITGAVVKYAPGGGGGNGVAANGGDTGGGQGEYSVGSNTQTAGAANTGAGGGGCWSVPAHSGGNGGSGKVIIRWEM